MSSIIFFIIIHAGADYLHQHNFIEASRYYNLLLSTAPSYEASYGAAVCALKDGQLNTAIRLFAPLLYKKHEILYYLGVVYYQLGMCERAVYYFNLLELGEKRIWQTHYYLGLINLKQNKITEAMKHFARVPDSVDKKFLIDYIEHYNRLVAAQQKFKEGRYDEAISLYENVEYFFGYREIGMALALAEKKEYKKSLILLDSVLNHSDNTTLVARGMFEAAKICLLSNKISKARKYLTSYLAIESNERAQFLLGKTYSDEARYDSAKVYFKSLPESIDEYLFYKGRADYFLGFWAKAEDFLLRHRENFPQSIYGDRATFILASINFKRKEYNHAIDFWHEFVVTYPQSIYAAAAQKGIGDAYFNLREYRSALNAYRSVEEYKPSATIASQTELRIYETLYHLKKYLSLIDALRKFVEKNPRSQLVLKTRMRIAKILFDKKQYYQSISELNRIIERYPDSATINKAMIEKVRIYQLMGNKKEAKKIYLHLVTKTSAEEYHSYATNELGMMYLEELKYDSSLYYYNLLLGDEKYREKAMFEIVKIYDILGQNKEAETMIDKLISEYPSSVFLFDAYILKTKAYKKEGYYEEAIDILEGLIKKVGQKPEIYVEVGNIYFEIEDYLNARKNYLTACEYFKQRRDDAAKTLLLAGDASVSLGDKEAAREYYLQANLIAESIALKNQATAKISTIGEE